MVVLRLGGGALIGSGAAADRARPGFSGCRPVDDTEGGGGPVWPSIWARWCRRILVGLPEFHGKHHLRLDLLRFVLVPVPGDCDRRLPVPTGRIRGKLQADVAASPKSPPYGVDPLPRGFGVDHVLLTSSMSSCESVCSSALGDDDTCVSCSVLKASVGDCLWWWSCWWFGVGVRWPVGGAAWHLPYRRRQVSAPWCSRVLATDESRWTGIGWWRYLVPWRH